MRIYSTLLMVILSLSWLSCKEDEPVAIEVVFAKPSAEVQLSVVTLTSTFTINRGNVNESGFLFGESAGLTISSATKLPSTITNSIRVIQTGLALGKQYFARPYAIAENETFVGEEISFSTFKPSYSAISPLTAGRGQRVTITGDFGVDNVTSVQLKIGGTTPTITSYSKNSLTFLIPESLAFEAQPIDLQISGYTIAISEKVTVSRWSTLSMITSPNLFIGGVSSYQAYSFINGNLIYHFVNDRAYVYDIATDTWSQDNTLKNPDLLTYPIYFQIGTKGYAGLSFNNKELRQFDLTTKTWSTAGTFPGTARTFYYGVFSARGTKGYYGLGYGNDGSSGAGTPMVDFWEFDSSTNQWTQRKDYPGTPIGYGIAFTINEYVFAGIGINKETGQELKKVYAFNTLDNTWTQVADFPGPYSTYMKAFALGKKGFVIVKNQIWVYDFDSNQWSLYPDLIPGPESRSNAQVYVGSNFFIVGSGIAGQYLSDFYKLYPY